MISKGRGECSPVFLTTGIDENMDEITLNAHAKLNLSLRVTGKRSDGYHDIDSFMQGTGLHERVSIKLCPENGTKYNLPHCKINGIVVYLCTDANTIPKDMSNLAFKGIKAFLDRFKSLDKGNNMAPAELLVNIEKKLPVAAGIAGGSGNAAVCMLGINALCGMPFTLRELMDTGASVGADVPFSVFMNAYRNRDILKDLEGIDEARDSALTSGIGEKIEAADPVPRYVILANPGTVISTQEAYEAIDSIGYSDRGGGMFENDFEKYTFSLQPAAANLREIMSSSIGADEVLMSGSGPTIAAYYKERNKAEEGMAKLSELTSDAEGVRLWFTDTGI